jgi:pSer/pThr/pTyr-binding forkhead associated (FHA) protein
LSLELHSTDEIKKQSFTSKEISIGRDPTSSFQIQSETVSAHHAKLNYNQGQWWLEDLNSTNGSFLNDERVDLATIVVSGDRLRCGEVDINISIEEK